MRHSETKTNSDMTNSDWQHGLEFYCKQEATLVRGARLS